MKNKISTIILSIILSLPITVWAEDNVISDKAIFEQVPVANQLDEDIDDIGYKVPSKNKIIIKKFLYAMGGVATSSFAIFFLLTLYNRIRERYNQIKTPDGQTTLETPKDYNSAVRIFLEKTKW